MKSLYIRVWLTVVVVLALFALGSAWLAQRHVNQERERLIQQGGPGDRVRAMGELIAQALPEADEDRAQQAAALRGWSERLRMPLALDDAKGQRIATSASFERRMAEGMGPPAVPVMLDDGRTLWMMRGGRPPGERRGGPDGFDGGPGGGERGMRGGPGGGFGGQPGGSMGGAAGGPGGAVGPGLIGPWALFDPLRSGGGLVAVLALLFLAVAVGAYPVVRRITRRLESLQRGVERFGGGSLGHRVDDSGHDEVAQLAAAFNRAADRIEGLMHSHTQLVANASHELRSPLARLKVALGLLQEGAEPAQEGSSMRQRLRAEVEHNLRELDALIEELLLSSRLQAQAGVLNPASTRPFDLLATVAEEAARGGADLTTADGVTPISGEERLMRRAVRNLLENAARYGHQAGGYQAGQEKEQGTGQAQAQDHARVEVELRHVQLQGQPWAEVRVLDRGPGVPLHEAQRIFEPFYRLPGHAESEGGVGLGLALVRQIAQHHGGQAEVQPREGGGSCFLIRVPRQAAAAPVLPTASVG